MENSAEQEKQMRRYLLGEMPEGEMDALDARLFAEPEVFDRMWGVENDLIDNYVRDHLSRAERARFESHYLSTPEHRGRVSTARQFLRTLDEENRKEALEAAPKRRGIAEFFRIPNWGLTAGFATALLLTALWAGKLLLERDQLRNELALATAKPTPSRDQSMEELLAGERSRNEELIAELERLRVQKPETSPSLPSGAPASITFLLSSSLVRNEGNRMQELQIPPDAGLVRLKLPFTTGEYKKAQVSIRNVDAGPVWRQSGLNVQPGAGTSTVIAGVPAAKLPPGDYVLTLSGQTTAGEAEEIDRYSFRVLRGARPAR